MADLFEIEAYCNTLLDVARFKDYCPNGLQIDAGKRDVVRVATAVTASLEAINLAIEWQADLLLVHHGYFWKGEPAPLVGIKGGRVRQMIQNGLSLMAYHLPLDAHAELGNNAGLGRALGLSGEAVDEGGLLWRADFDAEQEVGEVSLLLNKALQREPLHLTGGEAIKTIAWCTGAAENHIEQAAAVGAQAFISGEVSEQTYHLSQELGVHYFAAGHHATERFGVQALGDNLAQQFSVEHRFFDQSNPV